MSSNTTTEPSIRLYVLDAGLIECSDFSMFSPNAAPGTRQDMTVRSHLVVHPHGKLLWDAGIDDTIHALPDGKQILDPIVFKVPTTLQSQLDQIGIDPAEIDYLGLSHLHPDHVGNIDLFPNAKVVLQAAEYEAGFGPGAEELTLMPESYAGLNHDNVLMINGDHDLFGDGSVTLMALPGHTPGHQGLLVRLRGSGPILIASDLSYSASDYAAGAIRQGNVDLEQTREAIERAKTIEREQSASVWLPHDLAAQRDIRLAPAFYE
jgi:N-acyl homoserine lactone hydrolase